MKNIAIKEYLNFFEMFDFCSNIIKSISNKEVKTSREGIKYIRNNVEKNLLNSFCYIGDISPLSAKEIGSKTLKLKISADNLIKNIIEHPEIGLNEYLNISKFLKNADYILIKNEKNLIYFKRDSKIYQFVIKTTKNGLENFITTFHRASIKQLKKDLKRYKNLT